MKRVEWTLSEMDEIPYKINEGWTWKAHDANKNYNLKWFVSIEPLLSMCV